MGYAQALKTKVEIFQTTTSTKKSIILTLVNPSGLNANVWSRGLIERVVSADAFLG